MIEFTKNELLKAKAYVYDAMNLNFQAQEYLKVCKDDVDIIYLKAKYLYLNRKYKEAAELLEPYVLKNDFNIIDLYISIMLNNLDSFNKPYRLMQELIKKHKCFGYYGMLRLSSVTRHNLKVIDEYEMRELMDKAFKYANLEEEIILNTNFSNMLMGPCFKNIKNREFGYELKIKSMHLGRKSTQDKLYLIHKLEYESEELNKRLRRKLIKLIFGDFDAASALILGLYMIKNRKRKKIDYNDPAFVLFNYGHRANDPLCSILYALKFGHKDIKNQESLTKALEILEKTKNLYSIDLKFIPNSLIDTYRYLINEFNLLLTHSLVNFYKVHPFFSGKN